MFNSITSLQKVTPFQFALLETLLPGERAVILYFHSLPRQELNILSPSG